MKNELETNTEQSNRHGEQAERRILKAAFSYCMLADFYLHECRSLHVFSLALKRTFSEHQNRAEYGKN
jgi:hypothetical protein